MKVDAAGNVVKAYSLGDFYIPTQGALCPSLADIYGQRLSRPTFANRLLHDQGKDFLCVSRAIVTKQTSFGRPKAPKALMLVCPWKHADKPFITTLRHPLSLPLALAAACAECPIVRTGYEQASGHVKLACGSSELSNCSLQMKKHLFA